MADEINISFLCRRMSDESVNQVCDVFQEESRRRAHIASMVNDVNSRLTNLLHELCGHDIVDVIDECTGEVLLTGYANHLKDHEGPVIPRISVRCGCNNL